MDNNALRLRHHLLTYGPSTPSRIIAALGFSQPTLSRAVRSLGSAIIRTGAKRSTCYALIRKVDRLPTRISLYLVNETGKANLSAELQPIEPRGWAVESFTPFFETRFYPDLPYWLDDLRPAGFLGRLIPKQFPELNFPSDIRRWSGDDVVLFLSGVGWDGIGNILVGTTSFERYSTDSNFQSVQEDSITEEYDRLSREILNFGAVGSSAGGEQPKFLTSIKGSHKSVLVKFSPEGSSPLAKRRRDLLHCEHLALETLRRAKWSAAKSRIVESTERLYLQVDRFDRVGARGRRGILSLSALDHEFVGKGGSWRDIARSLMQERKISKAIYEEILLRYYFGTLIANSDMHSGNLSFYTNGESVLGLAPIYDMSPMSIAPAHEEVARPGFREPSLTSSEEYIWRKALRLAHTFWAQVSANKEISSDVKAFAREWQNFLQRLS